MFTVPLSRLQKADRYPYYSYTAEASEIGLPVGRWPASIVVPDLGNGLPFHAAREISSHGEFGGFVYKQQFGCLDLTVFND